MQRAVDTAYRCAGSAGLCQNIVIDHALGKAHRDLIALLHCLDLGYGAKIIEEVHALLDRLERQYCLIHILIAGFSVKLVHEITSFGHTFTFYINTSHL